MVASRVRVAGVWKHVEQAFVRVAGTWRQVTAMSVKDGGTWKSVVYGYNLVTTTGAAQTTDTNIGGTNYRYHIWTGPGSITVNFAPKQFRAAVHGGGAGGGYGTGGGHGYMSEGDYTFPLGTHTVTVGGAVDGGYHEVTNRDAPGNNGNPSSIGSIVSASGGVSRGQVIGPGYTTNITGSTIQYGGSGGADIINNDQNSGGYPGGGTGATYGNAATWVGGGGGGGQWDSGGGARGEVIVRYELPPS